MRILIKIIITGLWLVSISCNSHELVLNQDEAYLELKNYQNELDSFRNAIGKSYDLPDVKFFQFGMGSRHKLLYKNGILTEALGTDTIEKWDVSVEIIIPSEYAVFIKSKQGKSYTLSEDTVAVWLSSGKTRRAIPGTRSPLKLPDFQDYQYPMIMRELHHEILINIVDGKPVPNLYVYSRPWRRDGAMIAMCLEATGNLDLIKNWVLTLNDAYDRNNAGENEADNLGQTLYLLSLFTDKSHPLVDTILNEIKKFEVKDKYGQYIRGRSDFHETPCYQTKWLKFGLKQLGLPDAYSVPKVEDDYSALFWWDFKDTYLAGTKDANDKGFYPYLGWACDHFHQTHTSPISNRDYPLTWEIQAGQANYQGMNCIDSVFVEKKIAVPHTWHAAEILLYLLEEKK